jgi:hypothetical protein
VDALTGCALEDPSARIAEEVAAGLASRHGFARPAPRTAGGTPPADALVLHIATQQLTLAQGLRWEGRASLYGRAGDVLGGMDCDLEGPVRETEALAGDCELARRDLAALADRCRAVFLEDVDVTLRPTPSGTGEP